MTLTSATTTATIRSYTERSFTAWIDDIINIAKTGDVSRLKVQLNQLSHVTGTPATDDFILFITKMAEAVRDRKIDADKNKPAIWPFAQDVVASVKAWYIEHDKPCFREENPVYLKKTLSELTESELAFLVQRVLSGDDSQDDDALYERVVVYLGAPDFLDVSLGTDAEDVVSHIKQWHHVYRRASVLPDPSPDQPALGDEEKLIQQLNTAHSTFIQLLDDVKAKAPSSDDVKNCLLQAANRANEATLWALEALAQPDSSTPTS